MFRAVLDTNVYVAALISRSGAPSEIVRAVIDGEFDVVVSPALLAELDDVLHRPALLRHVARDISEDFVAWLRRTSIVVNDRDDPEPVCADPADDFLVALARASGARFLVSGDAHPLELPAPRPPVLTPRAFVRLLEGLRGR